MKEIKRKNKKIKNTNKSRLRNSLIFVRDKLGNRVWIILIILLVFSLILTIPMVKEINKGACKTYMCHDGNIDIFYVVKDKLFISLGVIIASLVPYLYMPALAGIGYMYQLTTEFSYIIADKGIFLGIILLIIPYVLNVISCSLITSVGLYMSKINTNKFKAGQQKNMNWDNFRAELYKTLGKEDKRKKVEEKIKLKQEKMEKKDMNTDYVNVLYITVFCIAIQLIASLIQYIII